MFCGKYKKKVETLKGYLAEMMEDVKSYERALETLRESNTGWMEKAKGLEAQVANMGTMVSKTYYEMMKESRDYYKSEYDKLVEKTYPADREPVVANMTDEAMLAEEKEREIQEIDAIQDEVRAEKGMCEYTDRNGVKRIRKRPISRAEGRKKKTFLDDENKERIRDLWNTGLIKSHIAREVGLSDTSVGAYINKQIALGNLKENERSIR